MGREGILLGKPCACHCNLPWHHPQVGSLLGHHILSRPRGHHPQLPTTYPLKTTYLLPGLEKLTLLPISGCFLFLKHQPLSFPSLEQLKLNFLMVLSFQTKGPLSRIVIFRSLSSNVAGKSYFLLHAETVSLICFSLLL